MLDSSLRVMLNCMGVKHSKDCLRVVLNYMGENPEKRHTICMSFFYPSPLIFIIFYQFCF